MQRYRSNNEQKVYRTRLAKAGTRSRLELVGFAFSSEYGTCRSQYRCATGLPVPFNGTLDGTRQRP